jgi:hypothetical protein
MKKISVYLISLAVIIGGIGISSLSVKAETTINPYETDDDFSEYNNFKDIFGCLNLINEEKDSEGNITSASLYCNENKTLTVEGDRWKDFSYKYTGPYALRSDDYSIDISWFGVAYDQIIKYGKLLVLETDDEGNYTYFAIGGVTDDGEEFLYTGEYDESLYHGYSDLFFVLGSYIVNYPGGWQEKLDWYKNESKDWVNEGGNSIILSLKPGVYEKWFEIFGGTTEEQYQDGTIPFLDTPYDKWYTESVSYFKRLGIISGYKDKDGNPTGYFHPEEEVTVAEFLKIALNAFGMGEKLHYAPAVYWDKEEVNNLTSDGNDNHWALKFFKIAKFLKTRLVSEPDFNLSRVIRRKEVAGLLKDLVASKFPEEMVDAKMNNCFTDIDVNDKYSTDICYFKQFGYLNGYEDGTYKPDAGINRAEAASIIRLFESAVGSPVLYGDAMNNDCTTCLDNVKLADFIKNLMIKANVSINTDGDPKFEFIANDSDYYNYLATAYNMGLIQQNITLYDFISKSDAAKMIVTLLNLQGGDDVILNFEDVPDDAWYSSYIKTFIENGIIENNGGLFNPADALTNSISEEWFSKI